MIGKNLKLARKKLDLTQKQMAINLNIASRTYEAYERGENNPPYIMLVDLCKKYNVNLNWLIADIGEMFNKPPLEQVDDEFTQRVVEVLKKKGVI